MPKKYNYKSRGKTLKYDHENMVRATAAVKNGSMSIRKAAGEFNVPKSTLGDKVSGRTDLDTKPGRAPALPEDVENKIVKTAIEASKRGMGISRKQLFARTGILCQRMKVAPFKKMTPGKGWWDGVKKRHPEITIRKPEKLGISRARMLNPTVMTKYFQDLEKILTELNIKNKPNVIWNCDETGKQFQHTPVKVISQKGSKNVVGRVSENRTNITIMACVNGSGKKMSPMLVVKGKTSASLHCLQVADAPKGTIWSYQENGWMTDTLGEQWFRDVFIKECGPERPQLLILDGHSSHESLAILELAMAENIHVLCLPPHTTHMLQPLDRTVFGPFNAAYNEACSNFLSESPFHVVNKCSFPSLFKKAWEAGVTVPNIVNGFRACGIVPFNPFAVPTESLHPSVATETVLNASQSTPPATTCILGPTRSFPPSASATSTVSSQVDVLEPTLPFPPSASATSTVSSQVDVLEPTLPFPPSASATSTVSSQVDVLEPTLPFPPSASATSTVSSQVNNYNIEDPQALLNLISSGKLEIVSANSDGVATFTSSSTAVTPVEKVLCSDVSVTSLCSLDTMWNNAVESIFLPPSTKAKNNENRNTKRNTSHRLLTSHDVLSEKREVVKRKEEKQQKVEMRKKALQEKQNKMKLV